MVQYMNDREFRGEVISMRETGASTGIRVRTASDILAYLQERTRIGKLVQFHRNTRPALLLLSAGRRVA